MLIPRYLERLQKRTAKLTLLQDIDLVHCRIGSIPSLRLERFRKVQVRAFDTSLCFPYQPSLHAYSTVETMPPSKPDILH